MKHYLISIKRYWFQTIEVNKNMYRTITLLESFCISNVLVLDLPWQIEWIKSLL